MRTSGQAFKLFECGSSLRHCCSSLEPASDRDSHFSFRKTTHHELTNVDDDEDGVLLLQQGGRGERRGVPTMCRIHRLHRPLGRRLCSPPLILVPRRTRARARARARARGMAMVYRRPDDESKWRRAGSGPAQLHSPLTTSSFFRNDRLMDTASVAGETEKAMGRRARRPDGDSAEDRWAS